MSRRPHTLRSLATVGVLTLAAVTATALAGARSASGGSCGDLPVSVDCGTSSDPDGGYFHGLIGVTGQSWVLDVASRSGNSPGCADCTWSIALDCPQTSPGNPDSSIGCAGMVAGAQCPPDAVPFRLYLTTTTVADELIGRICLGGTSQIVLVSEDADSDVERYLHDVTPPDLVVHRRPHGATLTGLPTYFTASVPVGGLGPVSFGSADLRESITLEPRQVDWAWGDGTASGWMPVDATAEHRYLARGVEPGILTTRWSATYTATFEGHTVGPFPASGELDHPQPFTERVDTSTPVLVGPAVSTAGH